MSRLGRGLNSLIKDIEKTENGTPANVKIEYIKPNRYQPRRHFDPAKLNELAQSIIEIGLIQPIIVHQHSDIEYELIAGERRLEASKIAGLTEIPVYIKNVTDQERLVLAIIENVQRENLSALEEAKAYKRLVEEFELTHAEIAKIMAKDRATISNTLRLLKLTDKAMSLLEAGTISPGHARAILSIPPEAQDIFADEIVKKKLSTGKSEELSQNYRDDNSQKKTRSQKALTRVYLKNFEKSISNALNTHIRIKEKKNETGEILITFTDKTQLENIANLLSNLKV
jgi:ParB family chromosome partitioning protein